MKTFLRPPSKGSALVFLMLLLTMSNGTLAAGINSAVSAQSIIIQKPVINSSIIGEALTGWIASGEQHVAGGPGTIYGQFGLTINSPLANITYSESGASYTVYDVVGPAGNSSGIGFVLRTNSRDCGLIIGCESTGPHVQNAGNGYRQFRNHIFANDGVYYSYQIKFIATSHNIAVGSYNLGGNSIGYGSFIGGNTETANVDLGAFTLKYQQSGCTASLSPPVINMGVISPLLFTGKDSTVASNAPVTIRLECNGDADVGVLATMTDQNNSSNFTQTLHLTPGTTATGVGIQFLREGGSLVTFGPDSSFVDSSSAAQWRVKEKSTLSNTAQFVLTPQYIQTANSITPGEANAVASITFAYD
ncbi:fimbrial protein [Pseudomonas sp. PA-1-3F]|uniref:fimbrial protein n=1 Tax=Pseudomonas sp. PA-1-3F TaxID=2665465 RepID=UPI001F3DF2C0|nr:fimbrial protein [Pseudomonas sp. PA-1-3F]MCF5685360.1 fimbrial protein [Pseudomonas sp. PA-1-3F]